MSRAINNECISLPHGLSKFPFTPGITTEDLPKLRSSVAPTPTDSEQGSTSTKKVRSRDAKSFNEDRARFEGDIGCFITGYTCLSLEPAHIIYTVDETDPNQLHRVVSPTLSRRRQQPIIT